MNDEQQQVVNPTESTPVEQDVKQEQPASSPVEVKQHEEVVPYSRLKEKVDEANYYKELLSQSMAQRQAAGETKQQIEEDPYHGMDPEVAQWQRGQDKRVQQQILKEAEKLAAPLKQQLEATNRYVTQLIEKDFRSQNKDVAPNSVEERQIASLIGKGVAPEQAAWAIMGPKRAAQLQGQKQQQTQIKTQQKAQANLETSSVPTHSGMPKGDKLTFRQELEREWDAQGVT